MTRATVLQQAKAQALKTGPLKQINVGKAVMADSKDPNEDPATTTAPSSSTSTRSVSAAVKDTKQKQNEKIEKGKEPRNHDKGKEKAGENEPSLFDMGEMMLKDVYGKAKYVNPSEEDHQMLLMQLQMQLADGGRETIIELGAGENGEPPGLSAEQLEQSVATLKALAKSCEAQISLLRQHESETGLVAEYLIRQEEVEVEFTEVRIAVTGNVDAGKSTFLGVLTYGGLDNGRGLSRQKLFRHKHELETGRTSSVGQEILGFDTTGAIVNHQVNERHGDHHRATPQQNWADICAKSAKVITFIDLAGHERYLKTTIYGLTSQIPDYCMLMVGSNAGVIGMTKEHLRLALALGVPVFVVVTKIDMCPPNVLESTMNMLTKMLKSPGCRKVPVVINGPDDVIMTATNFTSERLCPIFQISNVSGLNLDLVKMFLNLLHPPSLKKFSVDDPIEFHIGEIYTVPGVGTVVFGTLLGGIVKVNDTLQLGPDWSGHFEPVSIKSIHRRRLPVDELRAGQSACFALKKIKRNQIRKGMVLLGKDVEPRPCIEYDVDLLVLHHPTLITLNYQAMVHCGSVRQTARIVSMDQENMRTGDRCRVRLHFMQRPEHLNLGMRLVFRDGRTKAIGKVLETVPMAKDVKSETSSAAAPSRRFRKVNSKH
eukprot:comp22790_c0_seq1/m.35694 comp22790_c0_seq1/g.35694  ORF comp22790_c0_seq1/g.35694 comp22790_c0_seq1/m.35694 type:complete len:655 (-) comp22790_c0_seq1:203-2167(-)